ncbi:Voltage-dependent calcium channel gamma-6 subunit [Bagarius yarrelli]|uniref:Voltage-dependent calcium channel gamma-6 subunit n=1 Tax=Bagarius yarrelli TaxID=175774 RepID=A0A556U8N7_BAGYA|nr:Voltage-dependent calcium channel gamma-6 subunit [Bagarius yarrelli]
MWSTFVVQDEEARSTAVSGRGTEALAGMLGVQTGAGKRRTRVSSPSMSDHQEGKIKLVFLVAIVGIMLAVLGVGTEFWVELASAKHFYNNETCLAAHYGLWKNCMKKLWVADVDPERETCGPIDLPGDLTVISAMLAIFSLFLMMMGAVCIIMAISKGVQFFLKPALVCFTLSVVIRGSIWSGHKCS